MLYYNNDKFHKGKSANQKMCGGYEYRKEEKSMKNEEIFYNSGVAFVLN